MEHKPVVIIFCNHLLNYSATFIRSQAENLESFSPFYAGCRQLRKSLPLPEDKVYTLAHDSAWGRIREFAYKLFKFAPGFKETLKSLKPALIHAQFGDAGVLALPVAESLKVPLVVTFHGFEATITEEYVAKSFFSHRLYYKNRHILDQRAQLHMADSQYIKDKLLEQGFSEKKIIVHYVGVDIEKFSPDPTVKREPVVLFVGRMVEKKGCEYLLKAMAEVQHTKPEVKLVLLGDGELRRNLEAYAQVHLKNYEFLGVQPPGAVKQWMNRAKIFAAPSIVARNGDAEAFGIVFAEAQAMQLPVVSFSSGGIPEAVAHGETGFLAPERDWQTLAGYIDRLLEDETLWLQFSNAGRKRVEKLFDIRNQTKKLEAIYEKAIETYSYQH